MRRKRIDRSAQSRAGAGAACLAGTICAPGIRGAHLLLVGITACAASAIATCTPAVAQQSIWTGATSDYNTNTNWNNNTAPVAAGQIASFRDTGLATVNVSAAISPDAWNFSAVPAPQSYTITGQPVSFRNGGILDNADAGQTITIFNNLGQTGGSAATVAVFGNSTLVLAGNNTYSGVTFIDGGGGTIVRATNNNSVGTGAVNMFSGTFQAGANNLTFSNGFTVQSNSNSNIDTQGNTLTLSGTIGGGERSTRSAAARWC
jgi:autotransporter-associated beta strand protein